MTPDDAINKLENKPLVDKNWQPSPKIKKVRNKKLPNNIAPLGNNNLFLNILAILALISLIILFIIYYGDRRYTTGYLDGHQDQITYEKNNH